MTTSIELHVTQLNAANPTVDIDIISGILKVPSGTNNLELTDGTNTVVFSNAFTLNQESVVRLLITDTTMQIGVDGGYTPTVPFDGTLAPGNLQILQDGYFSVRNVSIYDEALADPWIGTTLINPLLISSATDCMLNSTVTIVTTEPYSTISSVTLNGTALTNIVEVDATTLTADLGAGGYGPINGNADLIVTDSLGSSPAFSVPVLLPAGYIVTKLTQAAAFAPGSAVDDEFIQLSPVTFNSVVYNPHVNPDGSIDFDGSEADIPLTLWLNDASDSYNAGTVGTIYSPDLIKPVITLTGGTASVALGGTYVAPTVLVQDNKDGDITGAVVITGSVDTGTLGNYQFQYNATDAAGNVADQVVFDVEVTNAPDVTAPVITLTGGTTVMTIGGTYTPPAISATDDRDGDVSANVTSTGTIDVNTLGVQTVTYNVSDAAGNAATPVVHSVTVQAAAVANPPVITVTGGTTSMVEGGTYTPPTVTAYDAEDGVIDPSTIVQTGTIDPNTVGTQVIYFNVSNSAGTPAVQQSHTVTVTAIVSDPTQFAFTQQSNVPVSTYITSNAVTVLGITSTTNISIVGGEYSINSGAYTSTAGTVSLNDSVTVRVISSSGSNSPATATLTVGTATASFVAVTEVLSDNVPDAFTLGDDVINAALSTPVVRSFPILGIDSPTVFVATGTAEVSLDGLNWTPTFTVSTPGTGYMRLTSSASNSSTVTGGVSSGGVSDEISITTLSDNAAIVYTSNLVLIKGKSRINTVSNYGNVIPITESSWDPDEIAWIDFQAVEGKVVQSVDYEVPNGWVEMATREGIVVTDSDGSTYDRVYSVLLKTSHTRNYHTIGIKFTYTDGTVDPRSVKVRVANT